MALPQATLKRMHSIYKQPLIASLTTSPFSQFAQNGKIFQIFAHDCVLNYQQIVNFPDLNRHSMPKVAFNRVIEDVIFKIVIFAESIVASESKRVNSLRRVQQRNP
jgi:hypothetical protein